MGKEKRRIRLFLVLTAMVLLFSGVTVHAASKTYTLALEKRTVSVYYSKVGTTKSYVIEKNKKAVSNSKLRWYSSDPSVAAVNSKGVVTAKKNGVATITVELKSDSRQYRKFKVCVYEQTVKGKFSNVSYDTIVLNKGNSKTLSVSVKGKFHKKYSSSDSSVVSVDQNGKITAKKNGQATIKYVTAGKNYYYAKVNVIVGKKVTKVATGKTNDTLRILKGKTYQLKPKVSPSSATNSTLSYKSSDTKVATVSSKGVITAKKHGTAVVTIKATDGSGKYARLKVVVQDSRNETMYTSCVIAHRGMSSRAPENSLPAFELAGSYGFDAVECDVRVTKDGYIVVSHDKSLERMCGVKKDISDLTLKEVKKYPIINGSNASNYKKNYTPTLDEFIECCNRYMMTPVVEIKGNFTDEALQKLYASIKKSYRKPIVISFYRYNMRWLRAKDASLEMFNVAWVADDNELKFCKEIHVGISVDATQLTKERMKKALKEGIKMNVWNVSSPSKIEYYKNAGIAYVSADSDFL